MPPAECPKEIRERLSRLDHIVSLAGADPSHPFAPRDIARVNEVLNGARRARNAARMTRSTPAPATRAAPTTPPADAPATRPTRTFASRLLPTRTRKA